MPANIQVYFLDDDDDLDEENIPGFSHPGMVQTPTTAVPDKGKGRAPYVPEQLAPPSARLPGPELSGNIGSSAQGASRSGSGRQTVGGVQVETRYSGVDTLDEPVTATIVSLYSFGEPAAVAY